jgi:dienelactone hydrolase
VRSGMRLSVLVVFISTLTACASIKLPAGVSPVQATWLYGRYTIPASYTNSGTTLNYHQPSGEPDWTMLASQKIKPGSKLPVVLYLHGCAGFSQQDVIYRKLLVSKGYAVFMPDSFMRPWRAKCRDAGPLDERVEMRKQEIAYALHAIRQLPWVNQQRVILMGFSEGGNATDSWSKPGFAAHIVLGSACTLSGGQPAAPAGVPVLAIVGSLDQHRPGQHCRIKRTMAGSQSIVIAGARHSIAKFPQTQHAIRRFLQQCCS